MSNWRDWRLGGLEVGKLRRLETKEPGMLENWEGGKVRRYEDGKVKGVEALTVIEIDRSMYATSAILRKDDEQDNFNCDSCFHKT
jgi:hypothetical protein